MTSSQASSMNNTRVTLLCTCEEQAAKMRLTVSWVSPTTMAEDNTFFFSGSPGGPGRGVIASGPHPSSVPNRPSLSHKEMCEHQDRSRTRNAEVDAPHEHAWQIASPASSWCMRRGFPKGAMPLEGATPFRPWGSCALRKSPPVTDHRVWFISCIAQV